MTLPPATEDLLRQLAPQVLGAILRRHRHFPAAEDAVQEALLAAATQWPRDGVPANPRGWLIQVASRRFTDQVRADSARRRREAQAEPARSSRRDDSLLLLFLCCHPALTRPSAIALTLRAVGGLTTAEIAAAFLVPETTMAQRISRAKTTIQESGIPFSAPSAAELPQRLASVLHVLYLIFNEGYTASAGAVLHRADLANEAIRLTRAVHRQLPQHGETAGLLALLLLTDARRPARSTPSGELIPLHHQDRSLWSQPLIREGLALVRTALSSGAAGPYSIQAAIAALHDEAPAAADTDWPQILALYTLLLRMSDNPMVRLNHAVAAAMVHGPAAGLSLLDALTPDPRLAHHHRLPAVRAHLLEMAGLPAAAIEQYQTAAGLTASLPERNYLLTQAARLASVVSPTPHAN